MNITRAQSVKIMACLLLAVVVTQVGFTALYSADIKNLKQVFWGSEALLFCALIVFSGSALAQAQSHYLAWSAIAFSAVLNLVQVAIGLTLFEPFHKAAAQSAALKPAAGAVVALSFLIYYAAKLLLGFAALNLGLLLQRQDVQKQGDKALGLISVIVGAVALIANALLILLGRDAFLPSPVAGASGVFATLVLAFCLFRIARSA